MGVQGLKHLVTGSNVLENIELNNSHIIIDAANVYYSLYFNSEPKLDQSHGGDYSGFKDEICRFLGVLRDCNVTPHMVLDGSSNPEKMETLKTRLQNKLEMAKSLAQNQPSNNILPPLAKDVFKQILISENIEFEESFGEADLRMASWANQLGCPVLSNDSDFYIYDLQGGVLPLDQFQWKKHRNGRIQAKLYRRSEFCRHFRLDPALAPVFAAIAGNDYSKLEDRGRFIQTFGYTPPQPRLQAILRFLADVNLQHLQTPQDKQRKALSAALAFVGNEPTDNKCFLESIRTYEDEGATAETRGEDLPQWMVPRIKDGRLTSFVTDVLRHRRMMLTPLVEDFSQPSGYTPARPLRQLFYGLLGQSICTEYDRVDARSVSATEVPALQPSVHLGDLQHLDQVPEAQRLQVLLGALDSRLQDLLNVPEHMKLQVCATRFWWKYRQDQSDQYLHALLLGFVYGQHLRPGSRFEKEMEALKAGGVQIQLHPDVAHAFSQWQCCFRQSLLLNQLLCLPLPEPECFRLYCGPVVHQLAGPQNHLDTVRQLMDEAQRGLFDSLNAACRSLEDQGAGSQKRNTEAEHDMRKKSR
ncbi:protein asteroid homolog 1-like [Betta splendens]|uniref:Protein asteroid homolog 1-like n=1 Tax=Betta splendens TaxID=158456 RepID=A0A6P7NJ27_BETSP|nr:protein asteroid homolog 1-like [Betta splendens]